MKKECFCYVLLPIFSIVGVLTLAWATTAFVEIFTNNLTMIRILDSTMMNSHIDDETSRHGNKNQPIIGDEDNQMFWFVQVRHIFFSFLFFCSSFYAFKTRKKYDKYFYFCIQCVWNNLFKHLK